MQSNLPAFDTLAPTLLATGRVAGATVDRRGCADDARAGTAINISNTFITYKYKYYKLRNMTDDLIKVIKQARK